jgi:hypothetical protein
VPPTKPKLCITYERSGQSREADYAFARFSQLKGKRHPDLRRRYEFARELAHSIGIKRGREKHLPADEFRRHLARWKKETGHLSSLTKAMDHPSYKRIIELAQESSGFEIERLLLNELAIEPDHWFQALTEITGEDPVKPEDDFDAAVSAWLDWGKRKGIIS